MCGDEHGRDLKPLVWGTYILSWLSMQVATLRCRRCITGAWLAADAVVTSLLGVIKAMLRFVLCTTLNCCILGFLYTILILASLPFVLVLFLSLKWVMNGVKVDIDLCTSTATYIGGSFWSFLLFFVFESYCTSFGSH